MTRKVVSPIALDKSINTTEQTPRNIADVLAQQLAAIKTAIESGNGNLEAAFVCYYGVTTSTQIKDAIEDGKVPYFYYNGVVAQLWKVETDKYTFRTTNTRSVEGQTILDVVDYVVNGSVWSTVTREVSGGSSSGQSYIASVKSLADFDTTGKSGIQDLVSVANVPADGVYQVSVMLHITPKTASATKSDLVLQFTSSDNTGWPSHTFHAVVDDSQTFAQQLSFSTSVSLKAGQNTLRIQCGGLNTEYLVFVDELTVAQLVNGVYHNGDDFSDVRTLTEAADFNNDDGVLVDGVTGGPRFMLWQTLANKVLGFIKSLSTTITAFRTGDVITVDGPSGTAKMDKDDLLRETAENALAGNIAPAFDATKPNGDDGFAYHIGDRVSYSGKWYRFILNKPSSAWDSSYVALDNVDYNLSQIDKFKANKFDDKVFDFGDWELGSFNSNTLVDDDTDNTVIRTALIPITKTTRFTVNVPTEYDMFMGCSTTAERVYWFDGQQQITIPANNYVRFAIKKSVRHPLTYDTPNNIFAESGIYCEGDKIYDVSDVKKYADTINESVEKTESFIRLPESLTISSSPVNSRYAIMINDEKGIFIKTITPRWAKSEGSFNWRFVYGILNEVNTKVILGEEHSATIGDSIFVNSYINKYIGLLLYSSTSGMLYVDNTGDPTKNHPSKLALFSVGGSPNKVMSFLDNYAPYCAFLTRETADEPFENINKLSGKFIAAIGDSMVYGDTLGASKTWLFKISQRNGMPSLNLGKNATFLSNRQQGGKNNSVYHRICDPTSPFYVSDDVLKRCDYFIVYSGTNDCDKNVTIGNVDSSNTQEFCGALNAICDTLQTRSPKTRFAFITPYVRSGIEAKCVNYINAIKNVCSKYGIPVFDNGALGGINWNNASIVSALTMNDTFHLNEAGMEWVSFKYESFIKSL